MIPPPRRYSPQFGWRLFFRIAESRVRVHLLQFNFSSALMFYCVSGFLMIGVFCSMLPGTNSVFTSVS